MNLAVPADAFEIATRIVRRVGRERRLRRGVTAQVRATLTPATGAPVTVTKTIRLRR